MNVILKGNVKWNNLGKLLEVSTEAQPLTSKCSSLVCTPSDNVYICLPRGVLESVGKQILQNSALLLLSTPSPTSFHTQSRTHALAILLNLATLYIQIFVSLKNKNILLYNNHGTMIKFRKFNNTMIHNPFLNFTNGPNNVL